MLAGEPLSSAPTTPPELGSKPGEQNALFPCSSVGRDRRPDATNLGLWNQCQERRSLKQRLSGVKGMRSIRIDVRFNRGRVRVHRATGVTNRRVVKHMKTMLWYLWRLPQYRYLVLDLAAHPPKRHLLDVYHAWVNGTLDELLSDDRDERLDQAVGTWIEGLANQVSEGHRRRLRQVFNAMTKGIRHKPRLSEIPELLLNYRDQCVRAGKPVPSTTRSMDARGAAPRQGRASSCALEGHR